jgi:ferredoxin-like protein FixX
MNGEENGQISKKLNVREYRRDNQKRIIQRNWQHRVHKTKKNKTKTQHNMCWTTLYTNKHKQGN